MSKIEALLSQLPSATPAEEAYFLESGLQQYRRSRQFSALRELGISDLTNVELSVDLATGLMLSEAGNLQQAFKYYQLAAKAPSTEVLAKILMANGLKDRGNNRAAIAQFLSVPLENIAKPLQAAVFKGLGSAHRDAGNPERANEFINKALALDPDNYRYLFSKAYLYHHSPILGDVGRDNLSYAVEYYRDCLSKGGNQWSAAHHHLALAYALQGSKREVVLHLSHALQLFQESPSVFDPLNRSLALVLMDSFEEGIATLENNLFRFNYDSIVCALRNAQLLLTAPEIEVAVSTQISRYSDILLSRLQDLKSRDAYQDGEWRATGVNIDTRTHNAIVAFIDVRGFTNWLFNSTSSSSSSSISTEVASFYNLCWELLHDTMSYCKFVGDGLMVVQRLYGKDQQLLVSQIQHFLESLKRLQTSFGTLGLGGSEPLMVGIGVSAGPVIRLATHQGNCDYIGNTVNLAARLCNEARPEGLAVALDVVEGDESSVGLALRHAADAALPDAQRSIANTLKGLKGINLPVAIMGKNQPVISPHSQAFVPTISEEQLPTVLIPKD